MSFPLINHITDALIGQSIIAYHRDEDDLIYIRLEKGLLCIDGTFGLIECEETLDPKALQAVGILTEVEYTHLTQERAEKAKEKRKKEIEQAIAYYAEKIGEMQRELEVL